MTTDGRRITLDNDAVSWMELEVSALEYFIGAERSFQNNLWQFKYWAAGSPWYQFDTLVAAACVSAGSKSNEHCHFHEAFPLDTQFLLGGDKCPCAPLPTIELPGGVPALIDTVGPCTNSNHKL